MERDDSYIVDVCEAIKRGEIPAKFASDCMDIRFDIIEVTDTRGHTSTWQAFVHLLDERGERVRIAKTMLSKGSSLPEGYKGVITVESITHKGTRRPTAPTEVSEGKNRGKVNATNPLTQAIKMALSKHKMKLKQTDEGADMKMREGIIFPMLVRTWKDSRGATPTENDYREGLIVERKYDGMRAIAHLDGSGSVEIYSRKTNRIAGLDLISAEVLSLLSSSDRSRSLYLDGELYKHGKPLQLISGTIRGEVPSSILSKEEIEFHVFDLFDSERMEMPAMERKRLLGKLFSSVSHASASAARVKPVSFSILRSEASILEAADQYVAEGYEGAIVRLPSRPYEPCINGYHSYNVLKVKALHDSEFIVTGMTQGINGKEVGAIIFVCSTATGTPFTAVPKGITYPQRRLLFSKLQEIENGRSLFDLHVQGKLATIQYANLSEAGVPLQPKFKCLRSDTDTADFITHILLSSR